MTISKVPREWGYVISPILVAIHLEVEGRDVKGSHTESIAQYLLWGGGDRLFMFLIHIARKLNPNIPRRTFYWYLNRYNLSIADIRKLGMVYPDAKGEWVWTLKEVRDSLRKMDTVCVELYRLNYLVMRPC